MIKRRISKQISIGDVKIGGNAPISVQTMCNTDTRDVKATLNQIKEFEQAGCDIVWANEFDPAACKTYRHNFGSNYLVEGDIKSINKNSQSFYVLAQVDWVRPRN